jgi:hypothetical protein
VEYRVQERIVEGAAKRQREKRRGIEKKGNEFKFDTDVIRLVEETEAHVLIGLLLVCNGISIPDFECGVALSMLTLFLLLLLLLSSGGSTTGSGGGSGGRASGADVGQELLDVLALESL